jgi:hypothetical protein
MRDGKVTEAWHYIDDLASLDALGDAPIWRRSPLAFGR